MQTMLTARRCLLAGPILAGVLAAAGCAKETRPSGVPRTGPGQTRSFRLRGESLRGAPLVSVEAVIGS
ncbi:MAG TPA: hypothetical protein VN874_05235, partial [Myxococcales bacterium]|nr:hypothetical protein [Myxococcales bacterium]